VSAFRHPGAPFFLANSHQARQGDFNEFETRTFFHILQRYLQDAGFDLIANLELSSRACTELGTHLEHYIPAIAMTGESVQLDRAVGSRLQPANDSLEWLSQILPADASLCIFVRVWHSMLPVEQDS
jgi:hypothetical protein